MLRPYVWVFLAACCSFPTKSTDLQGRLGAAAWENFRWHVSGGTCRTSRTIHHWCGPWHPTKTSKTYYQNNKYCINLACDPSWDDDIPFHSHIRKVMKNSMVHQSPPSSYWLTPAPSTFLGHHLLVSEELDFCTTVDGYGKTMNKIPMIDAEITTPQPCSWFNQFNHHMFFSMGNPT